MVLVVDYGAGNLASVKNSLEYLGYTPLISSNKKDIHRCTHIIVPGVGDGSYMMQCLYALGWTEVLIDWAAKGNPLLGICVGAQVLLSFTEEGSRDCLDIISGHCKKFKAEHKHDKIPHMGWNTIRFTQENIPLLRDIQNGTNMYFVHSYYLSTETEDSTLAYTDYIVSFSSIIAKESVFGVQFHPEKSGASGLQLLRNFLSYY